MFLLFILIEINKLIDNTFSCDSSIFYLLNFLSPPNLLLTYEGMMTAYLQHYHHYSFFFEFHLLFGWIAVCILGNDIYYSLIISATFYKYIKIGILSNTNTWKEIIFAYFYLFMETHFQKRSRN